MSFTVIILAAGKGSRLKSERAKPLHALCGKPLVMWVADAAEGAGAGRVLTVTGPDSEAFEELLGQRSELITQDPPRGTGHAVACCLDQLCDLPAEMPVVILYADTPLITQSAISDLAENLSGGADICVCGFDTDTPDGYGRLIMDGARLTAIIEDRDATDDQREITLVNGGVMAARAGILTRLIPQLKTTNAQGEYYLTDLVGRAAAEGADITVMRVQKAELAGINDQAQLAAAQAVIQQRLRAAAMQDGVCLQAPETVFLSADTVFGSDVTIEPHVVIGPGVRIGTRCVIKSFSHIESAELAEGCVIGPYARLRPGTILQRGVKIGNFVETKNVTMGSGAKANHLSYLGDADIGDYANIGAGTITCNYDGTNKHQTRIGAYAFIGSNSALVAPVTIGDYALIGAGSTITFDVGGHDLALARATQNTVKGGADKQRERARNRKKKK